jgi:hypothetical protein
LALGRKELLRYLVQGSGVSPNVVARLVEALTYGHRMDVPDPCPRLGNAFSIREKRQPSAISGCFLTLRGATHWVTKPTTNRTRKTSAKPQYR